MIATTLAILRALWGFLRSPLGQVIALCVGAVLLLSVADARGYSRGRLAAERRQSEAIATQAARARQVEAANAAAGQTVAAKLDVAKVEIRWRTKTLTERIPYAIDPARAAVPGWLVGLHDEAATGLPGVPDAPGKPDGATPPVTDARLAEVVIGNYGACHANIEQLIAFQQWARATGLAK